ncbi:hypothetical protein [Dokdonella sp.]|uniref:hypothetical protein n=1 Tax=Dokdonella sp. TaxID=2291710 RepID=UPI002606C885|nr:hypothetical protein [Dokdonella sp.]
MNTPAPDLRARKQSTLIALVSASVALGIVDIALDLPSAQEGVRLGVTLLGNVALLLIGFHWLRLDALELDIRRPMWLNVCIVALAAVFVPYYLYKTRPPERRLASIGRFFLLILACMFATALGASLMMQISGTPPPPTL